MIRIITDTSALYAPNMAEELGICITPLCVSVNGKTYRELEEIDSRQFLELLSTGAIPASSQPSIGEKMDAYSSYPGDEIIDLAMADGLSGTYQSACGAREDCENKEHIHVVNTQTLCGPHRYLVEKAIALSKTTDDIHTVLKQLQESIDNSYSYLIPADFDFLKRGGRLTPLAATIGGLLKIVPIMSLTEGTTKKLEKHAIKRTFKGAVQSIIESLKEKGVNEDHIIYIAHALCPDKAALASKLLDDAFPNTEIITLELSPAFITQGGPGCIAIQSILK